MGEADHTHFRSAQLPGPRRGPTLGESVHRKTAGEASSHSLGSGRLELPLGPGGLPIWCTRRPETLVANFDLPDPTGSGAGHDSRGDSSVLTTGMTIIINIIINQSAVTVLYCYVLYIQ